MAQCSRSRAARIGLFNTPAFLTDRWRPDHPAVEERSIALMRFARLQSYNDYRERFGMARKTSFADLTSDPVVQRRLAELYGDIDDAGVVRRDLRRGPPRGPDHGGAADRDGRLRRLHPGADQPAARAPGVHRGRRSPGPACGSSRRRRSLQQILARNAADRRPPRTPASPTGRSAAAARWRRASADPVDWRYGLLSRPHPYGGRRARSGEDEALNGRNTPQRAPVQLGVRGQPGRHELAGPATSPATSWSSGGRTVSVTISAPDDDMVPPEIVSTVFYSATVSDSLAILVAETVGGGAAAHLVQRGRGPAARLRPRRPARAARWTSSSRPSAAVSSSCCCAASAPPA